ncbi:hypothetical protein HJG60_009948 [Phyllostomus discolor]|uniref:Uncharacterized protein n=1 Tax=Phyllostomus discolor TaxID=89673 RepID=A0A834EQ59_9CHIR|nr:hypothetical protein HJG60_009948 [Phyllostomus discolor]
MLKDSKLKTGEYVGSSDCWEIKQKFVKRFTQDRSGESLNWKPVAVISQREGCKRCWKALPSTNGACTQAGQAGSRRTPTCEGRARAAQVTGPVTAARLTMTGCALWACSLTSSGGLSTYPHAPHPSACS